MLHYCEELMGVLVVFIKVRGLACGCTRFYSMYLGCIIVVVVPVLYTVAL